MTAGIYSITNKTNGKRYIGKALNIKKRLAAHKNLLSKDKRDARQTNRHLFNAVKKYGISGFEFETIEEIPNPTEELLVDREFYWILFYKTTDRKFGYNIRLDSSTKMYVHDETRRKISEAVAGENNPNYGNKWTEEMKSNMSCVKKEWHKSNPISEEARKNLSEKSSKTWEDLDKRRAMGEKVAESRGEHLFYQYDKHTMELVRVWKNMREILQHHPDYHRIAIYGVCRGDKKSYRGYVWTKKRKECNDS